jgi:hypothetical protein
MLCALEVKGYYSVRSGKNILEIPRSWTIIFYAVCLWFCWEVFKAIYKKSGLLPALFKTVVDGIWFIGLPKLLLEISGNKILDRPSLWQVVLYVIAIAALVSFAFRQKIGKSLRPRMSDRSAALMLALLFVTKIGMAVVTGHHAILLKSIGCIAISIGTILMALGLLNAISPEESEFPATFNSLP